MSESLLTERWTQLKHHAEQSRLWRSETRFRVSPAGRRSGKTELAKRYGIQLAAQFTAAPDGWFVFAAPTHMQAKRIFWRDLKLMVPKRWLACRPSESELTLTLKNGSQITVLGMDVPERIEGRPLDWICLDEYANMKATVWEQNVRPALSTLGRPGGAWFTGVPEGRNHYYKLAMAAQSPKRPNWSYHHWLSADILDPSEIEEARRDLDELTFLQEYEASFVNFSGRAYYGFDRATHCATLSYNKQRPIAFCFDFNVAPAICVIVQESETGDCTNVIGEVYIPRNGNTVSVCHRLIQDWGDHEGDVLCYGDATGGARGTSQVRGSDWDIIRDELKMVFKERLLIRVPRANPLEKVRINAMNSRLKNAAGDIRLFVDFEAAPMLVVDLEGVILLEGGTGEIDKKADKSLTHLTDALGYYIQRVHSPLAKNITTTTAV
jgi:hypothetical protein